MVQVRSKRCRDAEPRAGARGLLFPAVGRSTHQPDSTYLEEVKPLRVRGR